MHMKCVAPVVLGKEKSISRDAGISRRRVVLEAPGKLASLVVAFQGNTCYRSNHEPTS